MNPSQYVAPLSGILDNNCRAHPLINTSRLHDCIKLAWDKVIWSYPKVKYMFIPD